MIRSRGSAEGFAGRAALAMFRLRMTVAASLAAGVLALCLILVLAVISIRVGAAIPQPR
ncbi:MAG: hypothetical protein ACLP1D_03200 [Xanthobacteraceae bacterium]|jgi:hypothetical protein